MECKSRRRPTLRDAEPSGKPPRRRENLRPGTTESNCAARAQKRVTIIDAYAKSAVETTIRNLDHLSAVHTHFNAEQLRFSNF